jgi:cyanophycinase
MLGAMRLKNALVGAVLGAVVTLAAIGGYLIYLQRQAVASSQFDLGPDPGGTLILCGGGIIPDDVRERFVYCAGGSNARIVIIPAYPASAEAKQRLIDEWQTHDARSVVMLAAKSRAEAEAGDIAAPIADATGVWISGGSQKYLAAMYVGTEIELQLQALLDRGGVVGGVSAGAAIMTRTMIAGGSDSAEAQSGFDLLPGVVVDQHFLKRNRTQRLLNVLAAHRELIGLGIDEQTAVVVERQRGNWKVIGKSYVVACLPTGNGFPRLEILKAGDRANIDALREQPGGIVIESAAFWDAIAGPDPAR